MDKLYFDHNATTSLDKEAFAAMSELALLPSNPSSVHFFGREARDILESSRKKIANSLNIDLKKDNYNIVFTGSGTESNNLAVNSFKNHKVFVSKIEHASITHAVENLPEKFYISVDQNGLINLDEYESLLKQTNGKKFVSIMFANNETGVIQNIAKLARIAHEYDAIFHCDAVQAFGKIAFNLRDLDCDLLTISSHKCGGPVGASALIYKKNIKLESLIKGGGQEGGIRSGTENVMAIVGFAVAADNIKRKISNYKKIEILRNKIEKEIVILESNAEFYSKNAPRLPNTSCIKMPGVNNLLQVIKFDLKNIYLSAGSACSSGKIDTSHVLLAMGIPKEDASCAIRVTLGENNNSIEADRFIKAWKEIYQGSKNKEIK